MTPRLLLDLVPASIEAVRGEVAAVTFFADERPLRGDAGRADWRLCGQLSRLLAEGRLGGDDALLAATEGHMGAPLLLGLGLGDSALFGFAPAQRASRELVGRLLALGVATAVLSPPGISLGTLPAARALEALVLGASAALQERPADLTLRVAGSDPRVADSPALAAAVAQLREGGVEVRVCLPPPPPVGLLRPSPAGPQLSTRARA